MKKSATSPLTSDKLDLRPVSMTADQTTQLRRYAARNGRQMPVSEHERHLYAAEGLEPPQV